MTPADQKGAPEEKAQIDEPYFIAGGFSRGSPDGNTVVYSAPDGLIVMDTGRHSEHSQAILDYAATEGAPVTKIINTHWHLDHTTGNGDIKSAYPGAKLYATRAIESALRDVLAPAAERTGKRLKDADLPTKYRPEMERSYKTITEQTSLLPDVPVESSMSLPVNGRNLELNVAERAATEADLWMWDPATRTAVVGDLVTLPEPFFDTACPAGWSKALDAINTKPLVRVIPGHGDPMSADDFRLYRASFGKLLACAADNAGPSALTRGLPRSNISTSRKIATSRASRSSLTSTKSSVPTKCGRAIAARRRDADRYFSGGNDET